MKYKKGTSSKVVDMISRLPLSSYIILHNASLSFEIYVEQYANDDLRRFMQNQPMAHRWTTITYRGNYRISLVNYPYPQGKGYM